MKIVSTTVQRRQLTDQVIDQLQALIATGQLEVGTKLPAEADLMAQLGVSRSTLREAVRVLAHLGLLDVRQGDGTYVRARTTASEPLERRLQRATLLEVYEVRQILELEAARLAAERRDAVDLSVMQTCLSQRSIALQAQDEAAFLDADIAFHLAVTNASKNSVLIDLYQSFTEALRQSLAHLVQDEAVDRGNQAALHQQLFDAIAQQNVSAAQRCTAELLDAITQQLQSLA